MPKPDVTIPSDPPPTELVVEDLEVGRRRRGQPGPAGLGPLRGRGLVHRLPVRRLLGPG